MASEVYHVEKLDLTSVETLNYGVQMMGHFVSGILIRPASEVVTDAFEVVGILTYYYCYFVET